MILNVPYIYRKQIVATGKFYIGRHNGKNKYYKGSGIDYLKDYKLYVKDIKKDLVQDILEYCKLDNIHEREEYYLKLIDAANNPLYYNLSNKANGVSITTNNTKLKQSLSSPFRRKILQYDLEGNFIKEWDCMNNASKILNISTGDLTCCCQNKQKSARNFQWKYYENNYPLKIEFLPSFIRSEESKVSQSKKLKGLKKPIGFGKHRYQPIIQYNKQEEILQEYTNIREACLQFKGKLNNIESNIGSCINGKQKTAYGFIWKKLETQN